MKYKKLKDWQLSAKILMLLVLSIISMIVLFLFYVLPTFEERLYAEKKEATKNAVEIATSVLNEFDAKVNVGILTQVDAQNQALSVIKSMRYNGEEYFWINDLEPKMIMHPLKPELNGTNLSENKDPNGKRIFAEMVSVCNNNGDGFVDYMWSKPGSDIPLPKISYVKLFKKWGWIVGSGIYVDDVEKEISSLKLKMTLALTALTFIVLIIGFIFSKKITTPLISLKEAAEKIASGDFNVSVEDKTNDEVGALGQAFNKMTGKLAQQFSDIQGLPAVVMSIDKEFNINYVNKMAADLLRKDPKMLVGQKCYDQFKTDQCKTENCACFKAMKTNSINTAETLARPHGQGIPIQYTGRPTYDKQGNVNGAIEFVVDITKVKDQEKYLDENANKLLTEMDKFADGDLTAILETKNSDDVVGKLFNGFNKVVKNIKSIIISVADAVQATASASNQISSSTEEMSAGVQEQSQQTTEVAGAVEEMTKTILETSRNSSAASEAAKNSGIIAKEGGKVVGETITGMIRIAEVVKKSAETVQELGKSSDQIGEIVQVIDDIADQTNLLALNAAIEAARAGEQGRGFAVVADEVRKLAERTTKATKEIATMIKQIQKDTEGAVHSMQEGTVEVEKGRALADKAGQSLSQIINGAESVVDISIQVAAASEEQSSTAEQISKSIEAINTVTNESATGIQQIARAAEDLNKLTSNLESLISRFKIANGESQSNYNMRKNNEQVIA